MLGESQWQALIEWPDKVKDTYPLKFIVTSCAMLYQLRFDIPKDRWTGFKEERRQFMEAIGQRDLHGVFLLAGDLHSAHAMQVKIPGPSGLIPLWEFCATPFEQEPNRMARYHWLRKPLPRNLVSSQELHLTYSQLNFGGVEVNFDDPQKTQVWFEIYGPNGRMKEFVETERN